MSSRQVVVCDVCNREERPGMPTDGTVPQVIAVTMHTHWRSSSAFTLDICRECAEKTTVFETWEVIVEAVKRNSEKEHADRVVLFEKGKQI